MQRRKVYVKGEQRVDVAGGIIPNGERDQGNNFVHEGGPLQGRMLQVGTSVLEARSSLEDPSWESGPPTFSDPDR